MEIKDKNQFSDIFKKLSEVMDKKMTQSLIQIYFDALSDHTITEIDMAVNKTIRECRFFPKPSEIIERIDVFGEKYI